MVLPRALYQLEAQLMLLGWANRQFGFESNQRVFDTLKDARRVRLGRPEPCGAHARRSDRLPDSTRGLGPLRRKRASTPAVHQRG